MSFRWVLEAQLSSGSTAWTDITNRTREVRLNRGYGSDEDEAAAGTLRAVLNNEDGKLTPTNSQSTWDVDLERGVRATVVVGGTSHRRFTGEAKGWIPQFTADHDEVVVLDAVDGFEHLSRFDLAYAHRTEVLDLDPYAYWPLDEDGEFVTKAKDLSGNGRHATYSGDVTLSAGALAAGGGSVRFNSTGTDGYVRLDGSTQLRAPWSIALLFNSTVSSTHHQNLWTQGGKQRANVFAELGESAVGIHQKDGAFPADLRVVLNATDDRTSLIAADVIDSGADTHAVLTLSSAGDVSVYANGTLVASTSIGFSPYTDNLHTHVGNSIQPSTSFGPFQGRIAEVAYFDRELGSTEVADLAASTDAYASELPGPRINRVLDWQGWPSTARDISTGNTPLAPLTQPDTVLNQAQDAAFADDGIFYISREGDATFQGRRDRWTRHQLTDTGRVATFSDTGEPGYVSFSLNYDTVRLVDRTEVSGTNVGTAAYNSSSTRYPDRTANISSLSNNEADIASRAEWHTNRWDSVNLRPDGINISTVTTGQAAACAQIDITDTVQLRQHRPGADAVSQDMRVTGLRERVTEGGRQWSWKADTLDATDDQPLIYDSTNYAYDSGDPYAY